MGGLFSKPKEPEMPPPPEPKIPEPPVAMPETGEAQVTKTKAAVKGGRGGTILAGQMAPQNIRKKKVLG